MGNRVKRIRTEVSESQMISAISEAWNELFKTTPSKEQISLVLAQNSLETGNRKSMWNFNVGNITTDGKSQYNYFDDLTTNEQIKPGVWEKRNLKYRAYDSLKDGAKDYLRLLSGKHYSNAWKHIMEPNPVAFSKALKQSGYYTANEDRYTKALNSLYNQYYKSKTHDTVAKSPETIQTVRQLPKKTDSVESILTKYLNMVAASDTSYKKIYKKALPHNKILIKINSNDNTNSIEFARILTSALDTELSADSTVFTDGNNVEIECDIHGPKENCFDAVVQLSDVVAETFKMATYKLGGVNIKVNCFMNKKSSYDQLNVKMAEINYRKFLLKII